MEEFVRVYRPYFRMGGWLLLAGLVWYVASQAIGVLNAPMIQTKGEKTQVSLTVPGSSAKPSKKTKASSRAQARIGVVKVVVSPSLNMRDEPSRGGKLVGSVKKGARLSVLGKDGKWYEVVDSKGRSGFVSAGSRFVKVVWMKP